MTSTLEWFGLPSPFPEVKAWGAYRGAWQYVITCNTDTGEWKASAKMTGELEGRRIDLGYFRTRNDADAACRRHVPNAVH